ncbi:hypothetical protein HAX54_036923 [Datura stramonium]|uniref:Uncharacterized protein n=1 Tax=Datura stramonium TaxID=4076 RepID=A0ABS8VHM7_DATST|nr:hypothetical protein [Datura stramonium]
MEGRKSYQARKNVHCLWFAEANVAGKMKKYRELWVINRPPLQKLIWPTQRGHILSDEDSSDVLKENQVARSSSVIRSFLGGMKAPN